MKTGEARRAELIEHFTRCLQRIESELADAQRRNYPRKAVEGIRERRDDVIQNLVEIKTGSKDALWNIGKNVDACVAEGDVE